MDECPCCSVVDGGIDDCVIGAYYNPNYFIHSVKRKRERERDIGQNVANGGLEYKCFLCTWHTDN